MTTPEPTTPEPTTPEPTTPEPTKRDDVSREDTDALLAVWADEVRSALGIEADVDIRAVLSLAGVAAHSVVRPAAPLTTYLVGFAAGRAAANGEDAAVAAADATDIAKKLAARRS